ncbi:MAG TPA: 50S ribosomal protein L22 [Candidatus Nanoarchaeia archaeon]|nr:50S ribosomal protein L22 [Candidatus Nanoarchaeia archaeon]
MKYATAYDEKKMARAMGIALPISMKKTVEVCKFVKGRRVADAIRLLRMVDDEKIAIPFGTYAKGGTGHKPGIGPGRYPKKVCVEVVKLLNQVSFNAKNKGLDSTKLVVSSMVAKKGANAWHFGRQRRRRMKRTHVEVVVTESEAVPVRKSPQKKATAAGTPAAAAAANTNSKSPKPTGIKQAKDELKSGKK